MIFNTFSYYLLFLLPAAFLFRSSTPLLRPWVCLLSGSAFFTYYALNQFGGAVGAACLLIFLWECLTSRFYQKQSMLCLIGIAQSIALLVVFKYWNFFTGLYWGQDKAANPWYWQGAFLPLGISFFTFEFIHYAVDRYRGTTEDGRPAEYLAFILFFPTMVAGPIKRYQDFLPKLRNPTSAAALDWNRGLTRILVGLTKKFAMADVLTSYTAHLNATDIASAERWILPVWLLAYGLMIYLDFSAYSDIAIGSARLFGIVVPENFNWPYLQVNITAFWRNWHISLSKWLQDYVYIPMGGSRVGEERVYFNLLTTMMVSGIWHGAGLNFLVWGLWHGVMLLLHRSWLKSRAGKSTRHGFGVKFASAVFTFLLVNLGWAFFAMDLHTALFFFKRLVSG